MVAEQSFTWQCSGVTFLWNTVVGFSVFVVSWCLLVFLLSGAQEVALKRESKEGKIPTVTLT